MPESAPHPGRGQRRRRDDESAPRIRPARPRPPRRLRVAPAPAFGQPAPTGRDAAAQPDLPPVAGGPSNGVGITQEGGGISKGGASPGPVLGAAPNPTDGASERVATANAGTSGGPSPLAIVSIVLLLAGVGLAVVRTVARRLA